MKSSLRLTAVAGVLLPGLALAHGGHPEGDFSAGIAHPFSGLDHLLVMVAVGLWAVRLGGRVLWALPLTFMAAMALGLGLGAAAQRLPLVEGGILVSVLLLGAVIAFGARPSFPLAAALAASGALFHGFAHGMEMPAGASGALYGLGMLAGTGVLHAAGVFAALGLLRSAKAGPLVLRGAGVVIFLIGVARMFAP